MNKLLVVEDIKDFHNGDYEITLTKDTKFNILGEVNFANFDNHNYNLDLKVNNNSHFKFNKVNILSHDLKFNIDILDKAKLEFNLVIINTKDNKVEININMLGNDSEAYLRIRAIGKNKTNCDIICNGSIVKNTQNNILIEDLKGLIRDEEIIKISPNMMVETEEVMANHLVTIGSYAKDNLFYLESKGLSEKKAKALILESFLKSNMSQELKERIDLEVKDYE